MYKYEVVVNSRMKRRTGPCEAKSPPASSNYVISEVFCDIAQWKVVIPYRRFGTTYLSQLQGSRYPKGRTEPDGRKLTIFFGTLSIT